MRTWRPRSRRASSRISPSTVSARRSIPRRCCVLDLTLAGRGTGPGRPLAFVERTDLAHHPRVRHATRLRRDVRVYSDQRGLVTLGQGLAGRLELSIQVEGAHQGRGVGAGLLADALTLVPAGEVVFAAVSPGNVRSLRLFLGARFVPVASEVIVRLRGEAELGRPAGQPASARKIPVRGFGWT